MDDGTMIIAGQPMTSNTNDMHDNGEFLTKETELTKQDEEKVMEDFTSDPFANMNTNNTQATVDAVTDVFKGSVYSDEPIAFDLKKNEDTAVEYENKPMSGKYNAISKSIEFYDGTDFDGNPEQKYRFSYQVTEKLSGNGANGTRLYVNKEYKVSDTKWASGKDTLEKMAQDLYTMYDYEIQTDGLSEKAFMDLVMAGGLKERLQCFLERPVTLKVWPQKYKSDGEYNGRTWKKDDYKMSKDFFRHYCMCLVPELQVTSQQEPPF